MKILLKLSLNLPVSTLGFSQSITKTSYDTCTSIKYKISTALNTKAITNKAVKESF
jgi:hypothetical protein